MAVEAVLRLGRFPIVIAGPRARRAGPGELDSVTIELQCTGENWEGELAAEGYEHLKRLADYYSMWVQEIDPEPEGSTVRAALSCVGLISSGEKRKRSLSVAGQQVSVGPVEKTVLVWSDEEKGEDPETEEPVERVKRRVPKLKADGEVDYKLITTPSGAADRWSINDAILQVRDRYYTTTRPDSDVGGTAMTPPEAPTPPPYPWEGGYDFPLRNRHPNGWVIEDRQVEELFWDGTTGLWAVDDLFAFYYPAVPD